MPEKYSMKMKHITNDDNIEKRLVPLHDPYTININKSDKYQMKRLAVGQKKKNR